MEKEDLKWEQNEVELAEEEEEEEELVGLQVRSSKATKELTNGKIQTNGHTNSSLKFTNGTEKSDLGDVQESSKEKLLNSSYGVEVEEETEPKEVSVEQVLASNNGVEEGTTEAKEELEKQFVTLANGTEMSDLDNEQERSEEQFSDSNNGVEVEEGKEQKEESIQQVVASNNRVEAEEGTEAKEESKQHLVTSTNGTEEGPFKSGHSVYYDKDEDSNFTSTPFIKEKIDKNPVDEEVQESAVLDIQLNGYLKSDNLSNSGAQPSKYLSEDHSIVHKSTSIEEIESADTDLINDSDTDVKDYDVENVLQKQNTHDLYCPNCKSCITRRVILRKRKRKIRISGDDVKRNKLESVVDYKVDASHAQATSDQVRDRADTSLDGTPQLAVDDNQPDREPEIFRCLSCFSFFIPTGNGLKLFRFYGEKGDKQNVKGEQIPTTNKNWFSSIFASDKGKASVEQGSGIGANAVKNDAGVLTPSDNFKDQSAKPLVIRESAPPAYSSSETQEAGGKILGSENQDAKMKGKMAIDTVGKSENATKSQAGGSVFDIFEEGILNLPNVAASSEKVGGNDRNDELLRTAGRIQVSNGNLAQESLPASQQTGSKVLITSTKEESLTIEKSGTELKSDVMITSTKEESLTIEKSETELKSDVMITSTKEESLIIEKSETELKSDMTFLNKGPDNESFLSSATTAFALNGLDGNGKPKFSTEIPQAHEQNINAMLPSESPVENNGNNFQLSNKDGSDPYEISQHTITKTKFEIHSKQPLNVDKDALFSSVKDALSIHDAPVNITNISVEAAANGIAGKDTVITVEAGHETTETSPNQDTQIHFVERQGTDAAEGYRIEIIKSIIFGGLAESITSLSVVSSAAGGDTTTLNILVLGMANLIGGLFIIFHNIWELKRDRYEQASNQIMETHVDRYRQLLGRRENFTMHAVVAVLSYIIIGLVPPIVFGFSFRKSDDREFKIVAVAAASLVCILMLAIGKAYVQRAPKPYFKTIATYIILGFTVSGVSYAAGILFKRLLEKLGFFQPSSTVNLLLPEIPGSGGAWASL
ncbi:PREDICTED: membrane protein of ER body-like protein isoform X2 [Nicotiana attenuata]|uniref:membrane protein of ER body-like protein isoform X2 n=1 Tax=Nicotiana attenuata TaxID=49451 RepID=UPI00090493D6|nr:PREDICTED: membrane protein of ER body-like protein isoform X2 [Nicotiana attenuata]